MVRFCFVAAAEQKTIRESIERLGLIKLFMQLPVGDMGIDSDVGIRGFCFGALRQISIVPLSHAHRNMVDSVLRLRPQNSVER